MEKDTDFMLDVTPTVTYGPPVIRISIEKLRAIWRLRRGHRMAAYDVTVGDMMDTEHLEMGETFEQYIERNRDRLQLFEEEDT